MKSIAEDLNTTEEKATEIYNAVLTNISGLRHFMEYSQEFCRKYGYVETKWGRRRHIPDMMLPPFEITSVLYSTIVFIKSKLFTFLFYYNTKIEMSQENSS